MCKVIQRTCQCQEVTARGVQCKRFAKTLATNRCWQHETPKTFAQTTKAKIKKALVNTNRICPYQSIIMDAFNPAKHDMAKQTTNEFNAHYVERMSYVTDYVYAVTCGICPAKKKPISKTSMAGRVRSWIEERSASSRQHYFRGGVLQSDGWRPNLFFNPKLSANNLAGKFKPYKHVIGAKWYVTACPIDLIPERTMLEEAERDYRRVGMQGKREDEPRHYQCSLTTGTVITAVIAAASIKCVLSKGA